MAASSASQFMPSVAAHGTPRRTSSTSTRAVEGAARSMPSRRRSTARARGLDISLTNGRATRPARETPSATAPTLTSFGATGHALWLRPGPDGNGDAGRDRDAGRPRHGRAQADACMRSLGRIGKNTSTSRPELAELQRHRRRSRHVRRHRPGARHGDGQHVHAGPDVRRRRSIAVSVNEPGTRPSVQSRRAVATPPRTRSRSRTRRRRSPRPRRPSSTRAAPWSCRSRPPTPTSADVVNFSVVQPAPTPFTAAGKAIATTDGSSLRLTVPPGVRSMSSVTIWLEATDTTTGEAPQSSDPADDLGHDPAEPEDAVDRRRRRTS